MKKILLGVFAALALSFSAHADAKQNNNNPDVVVVGGAGSVQISQCASVAGNCNNPDMTINIDGDIKGPINVTGDLTINGGKDGVDGKDGKDGLNGTNGKDGQNGKDGAKGEKGDKGDVGAQGAAGKDGVDGAKGQDGKDGKNGLNGKDGKDGLNGTNGVDGKDGAKGDKGDQGIQGEKGDTGSAGKDGVDGQDGKDGAKGEKGDRGETGASGKDGLNGKDADESKVLANAEAILTESSARKEADVVQQMRLDEANANIEANRQASAATNKRVAANTAAIANHEQRISNLEQSTSKGFADLRKQINDVKQDADAGIAGVAAMANIPQVTEYQSVSVGAGLGVRGSESAVAVGVSARLSENTVGKLSVAADSRQELTAGVGIAYGW